MLQIVGGGRRAGGIDYFEGNSAHSLLSSCFHTRGPFLFLKQTTAPSSLLACSPVLGGKLVCCSLKFRGEWLRCDRVALIRLCHLVEKSLQVFHNPSKTVHLLIHVVTPALASPHLQYFCCFHALHKLFYFSPSPRDQRCQERSVLCVDPIPLNCTALRECPSPILESRCSSTSTLPCR